MNSCILTIICNTKCVVQRVLNKRVKCTKTLYTYIYNYNYHYSFNYSTLPLNGNKISITANYRMLISSILRNFKVIKKFLTKMDYIVRKKR